MVVQDSNPTKPQIIPVGEAGCNNLWAWSLTWPRLDTQHQYTSHQSQSGGQRSWKCKDGMDQLFLLEEECAIAESAEI